MITKCLPSNFRRLVCHSNQALINSFKLTVISCRKMSSEEKQSYLSMSLEEKRNHYHCGQKYVQLKNIPSWSKSGQKSQSSSQFTVDHNLNDK